MNEERLKSDTNLKLTKRVAVRAVPEKFRGDLVKLNILPFISARDSSKSWRALSKPTS